MKNYVLLSWVAVQNDPFERVRGQNGYAPGPDGQPIPGPTLTLLDDPTSPYRGRIANAVFFRQGGSQATRHADIFQNLTEALESRCPRLQLTLRVWDGEDPTDHDAILGFLRNEILYLRRRFPDQTFLIHLSPGTPTMQTVWVLMASVGMIPGPVELVKSSRATERRGGPAAQKVEIHLDTFFKVYQQQRSLSRIPEGEELGWGPDYRSPKAVELLRLAHRYAPLKVPVLLLGERGTGKTRLAEWIRLWSPYRKEKLDKGWPAIACGQYSPETMRAELFGYKKGSFTGATGDHAGLLAAADGDTLFLDELGDISRDLQRLLIKALEEGSFQPLGSREFSKTDFRLLSATNRSRAELTRLLDLDFLDRISPLVLHVPPLRDLSEDLPWLWDRCLQVAARRARVEPRYAEMTGRAREHLLAQLRQHPLPGNFRDLFRLAWTFLASRADPDHPLTVQEAVDHALLALEPESTMEASRQFSAAFAHQCILPSILFGNGPLDPDPFWKDQQRWFAEQVEDLVRSTGRPRESLTTVPERTLRSWRQKTAADSADFRQPLDPVSTPRIKKTKETS